MPQVLKFKINYKSGIKGNIYTKINHTIKIKFNHKDRIFIINIRNKKENLKNLILNRNLMNSKMKQKKNEKLNNLYIKKFYKKN